MCNVNGLFLRPLKTLIFHVLEDIKKTSVMKCVNKCLLCVNSIWNVNLECEKSYLIVLKGSEFKIQKGSTIKTQNSSTIKILNSYTIKIHNSSTIRFKIVPQSRFKIVPLSRFTIVPQ